MSIRQHKITSALERVLDAGDEIAETAARAALAEQEYLVAKKKLVDSLTKLALIVGEPEAIILAAEGRPVVSWFPWWDPDEGT